MKIYGSSIKTCEPKNKNKSENHLTMYKISIVSEVCDIWGLVNYLCKCIGQGRIHSSSSLSVKNTSFNSNYWLHGWSILDPKEDNGSIHWSHCIEKILTLFPIIQDKIIRSGGRLENCWNMKFHILWFITHTVTYVLEPRFQNIVPNIKAMTVVKSSLTAV